MNQLKHHIIPILTTYLTALVLLNILPINGSSSVINNNFTLGLRWDYLGHALVMIPLFPLLMLKYNSLQSFTRSALQPLTSDKGGYFTRSTLLLILILIIIAVLLEGLQYFIPWRTFNVNDIVAGEIGVGVGVVVTLVFHKYLRIKFLLLKLPKTDNF